MVKLAVFVLPGNFAVMDIIFDCDLSILVSWIVTNSDECDVGMLCVEIIFAGPVMFTKGENECFVCDGLIFDWVILNV